MLDSVWHVYGHVYGHVRLCSLWQLQFSKPVSLNIEVCESWAGSVMSHDNDDMPQCIAAVIKNAIFEDVVEYNINIVRFHQAES